MTRNYRNIIGFLAVAFLLVVVGQTWADLTSWNAEITAANPLNWYKFDEASGTDCIDSGSEGLSGTYIGVTLAEDGAFGTGTAARFGTGSNQYVDFGGAADYAGDEWTAEYITKKLSAENLVGQPLATSDNYSVRLNGWDSANELGFVLVGWYDYRFTPVLGESLVVPLEQWKHVTFRKNADGMQAFIDGILVGTSSDTILFPKARIGSSPEGDDQLDAVLDEAIVYDRALADEEIQRHAYIALPNLIPDYFEFYADSTELQGLWSGDAALTLETTEVYEGAQAMKAEFAAAGSITKDVGREFDFSVKSGQDFILMLKGDSGNDAGDVIVSVVDPNGKTIQSVTYANGTQEADWVELKMVVLGIDDPNDSWEWIGCVQVDVGAAATMYFDNLEIRIPPHTPVKIVEWLFDDGKGIKADDNTGNGFDGAVSLGNNGWVTDGGNTGQAGDHAVLFDGAGESVTALNITLPGDVEDIFAGFSSWTINMWINLNEITDYSMIGGFGDCDTIDNEDGYSDRYFNTWNNGLLEFNYGDWGLWPDAYLEVGQWHMITATYNKWTNDVAMYLDGDLMRIRTIYNNTDPAYPVPTATPWLIDVPERAFKLGDVGIVANVLDQELTQTPLNAMIDDYCIWDGELPWMDDDPETEDILSLFGGWICYETPAYDVDGDCLVNMVDLAELISAWLESGRYSADL